MGCVDVSNHPNRCTGQRNGWCPPVAGLIRPQSCDTNSTETVRFPSGAGWEGGSVCQHEWREMAGIEIITTCKVLSPVSGNTVYYCFY